MAGSIPFLSIIGGNVNGKDNKRKEPNGLQ